MAEGVDSSLAEVPEKMKVRAVSDCPECGGDKLTEISVSDPMLPNKMLYVFDCFDCDYLATVFSNSIDIKAPDEP